VTHTILLIDHDPDLRHMLAEQFEQHDTFHILQAGTPAQAVEILSGNRVELILLDCDDGPLSLVEASSLLQSAAGQIPIIALTDQMQKEQAGLLPKACETLSRPFRFSLLLARMRALLHSHVQSQEATILIGPYLFRPNLKALMAEGDQMIRLTEKETDILLYLYRANDKAVTREQLLSEVWGYHSDVTTHTLETHIYRLRQKIEADPSNALILITAPGGYSLSRQI